MASSDRRLSTLSCQETRSLCHGTPNLGCHSLSKSSSASLFSGQGSSQRKQEIHKSLSSVLCISTCDENSIQHSHSSEWSSAQDGVLDSCYVQILCNHLPTDHAEEEVQPRDNLLSANSSSAPREQLDRRSFAISNVSENISLLGHSEMPVCKAQSVDHMDMAGTGFQKSYSDFFCSTKTRVSSSAMTHSQTSAIYSALCSSTSISDSGSDGTYNIKHDSGTDHSPNIQNNFTEVMSADRDQNISLSHLDSSAVQHNITVYAVPGTYHHGILGPSNAGNGFPNNGNMYGQPHYNIPGVVSCDNISSTKHSPPAIIIHNSCTLHCCNGQGPMMKMDDTIAAYCHPVPIPSIQFSPGPVCSLSESVSGQARSQFCSLLPPSGRLEFPKLVSSVSETGLDAKRLMRCVRLPVPHPMALGQLQFNSSIQDSHNLLIKISETSSDNLQSTDSSAKKKDTWTMTSMNYLSMGYKLPRECKDAEVQTVIIMENKSVATSPCPQTAGHSHVFPEVSLALDLPDSLSPIHEVRWDDEGMTWEVYGASVDPEVLGTAIQKHLEIQIEQHLQPPELSKETTTEEQSTKEKRRSFRTVMHSLRQSNCCVCTSSTIE
ncbi:hypothetical protein FKM82_015297 [Ascaphus truei]